MQNNARRDFAIIFDMDGVLIDSVKLNWQAMNEVLAVHDVAVSDTEIKKYLGRTLRNQVEQFNNDFGLSLDYQEFEAATRKIKNRLFTNIEPKEGVSELLEQIQSDRIPMAVATSMPRSLTKQRLQTANILHYFELLVTEDDVTNHKPDPETYNQSAKLLDIAASKCIVIEDAPAGVQAAKLADMACIAVKTPYVKYEDIQSADRVIESLSDTNLTQIKALI